jgi:N-acylneuraminate cytidylyltransferase
MRIIGLIPARGGSKGIPRKNLQKVNGVPLLAHKIVQAKKSFCNEIWVSTEDSEIKRLASEFGVRIIDRPEEFSQDTSGSEEVVFHAINFLNLGENDLLIILQPTSPLIKVDSINECISKLLNNPDFASVLTIKESHLHVWSTTDNSVWEIYGPNQSARKRRQDTGITGWETGGCYALRVNKILMQNIILPSPVGTVSVNYLEALDVDTVSDLQAASDALNFFKV